MFGTSFPPWSACPGIATSTDRLDSSTGPDHVPGPHLEKPSRNTVRLEPFCATRREATAGPVLTASVQPRRPWRHGRPLGSHCSVGTDSLVTDDDSFSCPRTEENVQILFSRNDSGVTIGDGDQLAPVEPGPEARSSRRRTRSTARTASPGCSNRVRMPRLAIRASSPDGEERQVLPPPAGVLRALERPPPVELEVPQVRDHEGDRRVDVVPADVEVGERQVPGHAVRVRADLVGQDQHRHVDEHAGAADQPEAEQQLPVVAVTDGHVVVQTVHDRISLALGPVDARCRDA